MLSRRSFLGGTAAAALAVSRKTHASQVDPQTLVERAMAGIDKDRFIDTHVHVIGNGAGGTGCTVHPRMTDLWSHPMDWIRFQVYTRASGITDLSRADQEYLEVLQKRVHAMPHQGRTFLLAFDGVYDEKGQPRLDDTVFHTPTKHVLQAAKTDPRFAAVASIHPYRTDAAEALHEAADGGAVAVKWLPNAMWIDPSSSLCDPAYAVMAERGLPLICHAGDEQAVHAADTQEFGNPLRLRRALDHGVTVIVAHCASHGFSKDLDAPGHPSISSFELFLRMMDNESHIGQLWGEISAVPLMNRVKTAVPTLLKRTDLHHRLVHGSDYPIPGVDPLINLWQLWHLGLIRWEDRAPLAQLFNENPILGDFVLKRIFITEDEQTEGFPPSVFCPPWSLFPNLS
jgi:predicted TIM-barrel fold metal-dependent hydrolase